MPTITTARMKQIVADLRQYGYYTAANSVSAITKERDELKAEGRKLRKENEALCTTIECLRAWLND